MKKSTEHVEQIRKQRIKPHKGAMWRDPDTKEFVDLNQLTEAQRAAKAWEEVDIKQLLRLVLDAQTERMYEQVTEAIKNGTGLPPGLQDTTPKKRAVKIMKSMVKRYFA